MKKVVLAVVLMTSPVFAQTPNLAPAPRSIGSGIPLSVCQSEKLRKVT